MFTLKLAHAQEQMQYLCVKTLNVLKCKLSFILFPKQQKQQKTSTEFRFVLRAHSLCVRWEESMQPADESHKELWQLHKALLCSALRWLPWPGWKGTALFAVKSCFIIPEPSVTDDALNCLIVLASAVLLTDSTIHTSAKSLRPAFPSGAWREQRWRDNGSADCVLTGL